MSTKRRPASATSAATPARKAAFELVRTAQEQERFLSAIAPGVLERYDLDPSDRSFARLLAQGALSLQVTLDHLIDRSLRSPRDIKPDVRMALRLAAYEIIYLHKEDHAAVDQGVELVRWFAPRATGVANYVLHRIVEEKAAFPHGDPRTSLSAAQLFYGFQPWLAHAIKKDIGTRGALALMAGSLAPAPVWFTNTCTLSSEELKDALGEAGIEFNTCRSLLGEAAERDDAIFQLAHRGDVGSRAFLSLLREEKVVVSDLSAQSVVARAVETLPREARVLEIGAGRGTKTLLFQSACARAGITLAAYDVLDISAKKLKGLRARVEAAGGKVDALIAHDALKPLDAPHAPYDLVFIDAPCTGIGTLRRHPELKARLSEDDPHALARIGRAMLEHAAPHVKPGGSLMFATCTILKEENEKTVKRFCATRMGDAFSLVSIGANGQPFFKTPIEVNGPDLHFACLLSKSR